MAARDAPARMLVRFGVARAVAFARPARQIARGVLSRWSGGASAAACVQRAWCDDDDESMSPASPPAGAAPAIPFGLPVRVACDRACWRARAVRGSTPRAPAPRPVRRLFARMPVHGLCTVLAARRGPAWRARAVAAGVQAHTAPPARARPQCDMDAEIGAKTAQMFERMLAQVRGGGRRRARERGGPRHARRRLCGAVLQERASVTPPLPTGRYGAHARVRARCC